MKFYLLAFIILSGIIGIYGETSAVCNEISAICINGGTCHPTSNTTFYCECSKEFTGKLCENEKLQLNSSVLKSANATNMTNTFEEASSLRTTHSPPNPCIVSNPCKNDGVCMEKDSGEVFCKCDENLNHGKFCQFSNGCSVFPCKNGGVCTAVENDFICECVPGYSGVTCLDRDPCITDLVQCQNGGTCSRLSNKYWKCNCPKIYTGKYCENQKPCLSFNPCLNRGTCTPTLDGFNFQCTCHTGFYGNICEFRDPCVLDKYDCNGNRGTCERLTNFQSRCKCREDYTGLHCELKSEEVNKCKDGFCQNNSTCYYDPMKDYKLKCICVFGKGNFGNQCEYFDPCLLETNQCKNDGICQRVGDNGRGTECRCNSEYFYGSKCEYRKACSSSPCLFGSECENIKNDFYCHCPIGRRGRQCEIEIEDDPCKSRFQRYCLNGGTCKKGNSSSLTDYSCACPLGFSGKNCENEVKLQIKNPSKKRKTQVVNKEISCNSNFARKCKNGGICTMSSSSEYNCKCIGPWIGKNCDQQINSIGNALNFLDNVNFSEDEITKETQSQKRSSVIKNQNVQTKQSTLGRNATKTNLLTGSIPRGRGMPAGSINDLCSPNPCMHKGTCVVDKKGYHCDCPIEFLGKNCEKRDPCKHGGDVDCLNGATCQRVNDVEHLCQCMLPYVGVRCEEENKCRIEPNECIDYPNKEPMCYPCEPGQNCTKYTNGTYNCFPPIQNPDNGTFTLQCVRNCNRDVILDNKIVLKCECADCEVLGNEWNFKVNGLGPGRNKDIWTVSPAVNATPNSTAFISIDPRKILEITTNKMLIVSCSKYGYDDDRVVMKIPLNDHPKIDCDFSITVGPENFAFVSKFKLQMQCKNQNYPANLPLTLAVYVKPHGKLGRIGADIGFYLIHHFTTDDPDYFVSKNEEIELVLPTGDPIEKYELPIRILLIDKFGRISVIKRLNQTVLSIPNVQNEVEKWIGSSSFPFTQFNELDFQQILAIFHYLSLSENTVVLGTQKEASLKSFVLQNIHKIKDAALINDTFQLEQMIDVFYAIIQENPDTLEDAVLQAATEIIHEYGKFLLGSLRGNSTGTLEMKNDMYTDGLMYAIIHSAIYSIETLAKRIEIIIFEELNVNKANATLSTTSNESSFNIVASLELYADTLATRMTVSQAPLVVHEQNYIGVFVNIMHKSDLEKPTLVPSTTHSLFLKNNIQLSPSRISKVSEGNVFQLVQVTAIISNFNPFLNQDLHNFSLTPLILFDIKDDFDLDKIQLTRIDPSKSHEFRLGYLNHEDSINRVPTEDQIMHVNLKPFELTDARRHLIGVLLPKETVDLYLVVTVDVVGIANMGLNMVVKREQRPSCQDWINQTTMGMAKMVKLAERTHGVVYMFETSTTNSIPALLPPNTTVEDLVDYVALLWFDEKTDIPIEIQIKDDYFGTIVRAHIGVSTLHCVSKESLTDKWKADCFVVKTNEIEKGVTCQCNHTSTIGSSVINVPITDQSLTPLDLFNNMDLNVLITYVVISCLITYVFLLIIACWVDEINSRRPWFILMNDFKRIKIDTFYLLTFETGNDWFAGTSAKVYCQIFGDKAKTKVMILNDIFMHCMRQNDESNFIFSLRKPLGKILKLHLWHDNAGPKPAWYCRKVVIRDIKTEETWFFFVKRWISVHGGTKSLSVELNVAREDEVKDSFKNKFALHDFWHQIREHHIWISPITTKPRSTHTRAERLTCAMALLCTYMVLITFLYGIPSHLTKGGVISFKVVHANEYYPIWAIGTKASLIGLIFGWLVVHFFRFVRRQMVPTLIISDYCRDKGVGSEDALPTITTSTQSIRTTGFSKSITMIGGQQPFRIPSTDLTTTENWVQEVQIEPKEIVRDICEEKPYASPFVHKYFRGQRGFSHCKHRHQAHSHPKKPLEITVQGPICITHRGPIQIPSTCRRCVCRNRDPCQPSPSSVRKTICRKRSCHHSESKNLHSVILLSQLTQMLADPSVGKPKIVYPDTANYETEIQSIGDSMETLASVQSKLTAATRRVSFENNKVPISSEAEKTSTVLNVNDTDEEAEEALPDDEIPHTEFGLVEYKYEHHQCLPRVFIYPAWGLSISIIIICSIINIYYGYYASWEISKGWCYSLLWALCESILVLQPFKACLAYMLLLYRNKEHSTNKEDTRVKTRFKLIWLVGKISPGIEIWRMPYCFHPLSYKGKLGIAPDGILFPPNRGKWRRMSKDGIPEPDTDSEIENTNNNVR